MEMGILDYIMSTALLLIFCSGGYCLWEHTKLEQKEWERRRRERRQRND